MKLRNKKTGEIVTLTLSNDGETFILMNERMYTHSVKLSDLEEWEDYEEPKEYWFIDEYGMVQQEIDYYYDENKSAVHDKRLEIGNCFETEEKAKKAVEKLKAWKRLEDKGFRFEGGDDACISYKTDIENWSMQDLQDFKTLFGGEE